MTTVRSEKQLTLFSPCCFYLYFELKWKIYKGKMSDLYFIICFFFIPKSEVLYIRTLI